MRHFVLYQRKKKNGACLNTYMPSCYIDDISKWSQWYSGSGQWLYTYKKKQAARFYEITSQYNNCIYRPHIKQMEFFFHNNQT